MIYIVRGALSCEKKDASPPSKIRLLVKVKLLYLFVAVTTTSLCNRTGKGGVRSCFAILRTSGGEKIYLLKCFC